MKHFILIPISLVYESNLKDQLRLLQTKWGITRFNIRSLVNKHSNIYKCSGILYKVNKPEYMQFKNVVYYMLNRINNFMFLVSTSIYFYALEIEDGTNEMFPVMFMVND